MFFIELYSAAKIEKTIRKCKKNNVQKLCILRKNA